jgi:hypothetical protein
MDVIDYSDGSCSAMQATDACSCLNMHFKHTCKRLQVPSIADEVDT